MRQVEELQQSLNTDCIRAEAVTILQGLIEKIILTPDEAARDGMAITLHGALAEILALGLAVLPSPVPLSS